MIWHALTSCCLGAVLFAGQVGKHQFKEDRQRLQGTWRLIYSETSGKGFKPTNDIRLTFDKDTKTEWSAGELASKSLFRIDPSKKPPSMDVTIIENRLIPESKGMKILCIYDLQKDRLKLRYPSDIFPNVRPTEFPTKEVLGGSNGRLDIYERVTERGKPSRK